MHWEKYKIDISLYENIFFKSEEKKYFYINEKLPKKNIFSNIFSRFEKNISIYRNVPIFSIYGKNLRAFFSV